MTAEFSRPGAPPQAEALVKEIEGYLLAQAAREQAHREAEALCARLPWLTRTQAEDVTRHYVDQRLAIHRQMLRATVRRGHELRREYETRYEALRHRLLARHVVCACAVLVCATGASAAVCALSR
ncbi:hypothetical protein [Streptomyces sp. enrichment culture]|uniref:hypothetical protein n=1 Tax=Streptomyces sp. enrichment culture TaxID=1795815 RepID=UPI003F57F93D